MTTSNEGMKRNFEELTSDVTKKAKTEIGLDALATATVATSESEMKRHVIPKARENRLEQNRKAARESRRRKKLMIEELQRSVIFFSKANGTLKMQNEELSRRYLEAKSRVASIEGNSNGSETTCKVEESQTSQQVTPHFLNEQIQAQAVAAQALYESQGFPSGAARAAAQAMNGSTPGTEASSSSSTANVPQMQPGATMQAMATFQQAAAAAMQAAMGMNPATNPQQIYTDAMNAFVQQNGHVQFPFMAYPAAIPMPMMWQHQNKTSSEVAPNVHQEQKAL